MILPDHEIKKELALGKLRIENIEDPEKQIQAAWVDLRLDSIFRTFKNLHQPYIDIKNPGEYTELFDAKNDGFILHPNEFLIGMTKESVRIPDYLAAYVDGQSSLGRLGVISHVTAGWIDPGFSGNIALEIINIGKIPVKLYPGMKICKLILFRLSSPAEMPYDKRKEAKYRGQSEALPSRINKEFQK
jgi:dCTP deaminase